MHAPPTTTLNAKGLRIAIAVSRYHHEITDSMLTAAKKAFADSGGDEDQLTVIPAPGSFELTAICRKLSTRNFDAILALGCLITGQTSHDQHIAQSVTQGLTAITVQTGMPIAFGVLTCQNLDLARARSIEAAPDMNKGAEAMRAAIETASTIRWLHDEGRR